MQVCCDVGALVGVGNQAVSEPDGDGTDAQVPSARIMLLVLQMQCL